MKLAEISIKRPSLVIVFYNSNTWWLFSYSQLGYELIPKFEQNVLQSRPFIQELLVK
jgi:HAE1 family hydrophobic/amphiphilic exporter-1